MTFEKTYDTSLTPSALRANLIFLEAAYARADAERHAAAKAIYEIRQRLGEPEFEEASE